MNGAYASLLAALETSWLGAAARSSTWLYPLANVGHVLAAALLVGSIAVYDVRLIAGGTARQITGLARTALPVAALGLILAAPTGLVLLSAEATATGRNPVFQFKMAVLALAALNIALFHARFRPLVLAAEAPGAVRLHGGLSLGAWIIVLCAGRLIAYQ